MQDNIKWNIKNINLERQIPDIPVQPEYAGVFVVFWWRSLPLGYQEFFAEELPISASTLRNLATKTVTATVGSYLLEHGFTAYPPKIKGMTLKAEKPANFHTLLSLKEPLANLEQKCSSIDLQNTQESVSVVICTRDRSQQLEACLNSLQNLDKYPDEIIVVDNAPTTELTKKVVDKFPQVRYVLESRPGLSIARNTGIKSAKSNIIAFTDDDVEVHPNWIERVLYGFQDPKVMVVTGLMLPAELETAAQVAFHRGTSGFNWECRPIIYDTEYFENRKPFGTPVWQIGAGANMSLRRQIIDIVGDFDERLGAGASGCSEDSEFWYRVLAAGWICRYEPSAVVYHYHRGDLNSLKRQKYSYMRGHVAALLIQASQHRHWGNLFRLLIVLPEYYIQLILKGISNGFQGRYRTIFIEIIGCFAGILFFLRNLSKSSTRQIG